MKHDLIHIQGKPYALVPLHEYRLMNGNTGSANEKLPDDIKDLIFARQDHPVKILRDYRGYTQAALAEKAGISRPYLTEIETGKKNGSVKAIQALAEALDVDTGIII